MRSLYLLLLFFCCTVIEAQNVSINADGSPADPSAILDISSTSNGLLIPRMTESEKNMIINPAIGLLMYQTDNIPGLYAFTGSSWPAFSQSNTIWGLNGNLGTDPINHFIGTTDIQPLRFKVNAIWSGELNPENGNTSFGFQAGLSNTNGHHNSSFGADALASNTSGFYNVAIGEGALFSNTTGFTNTAIGRQSLYFNNGYNNTAIGYYTLKSNSNGTNNTASGYYALFSNTTGDFNTANGVAALTNNTSGNSNTAYGTDALSSNISGSSNSALGTGALISNINGDKNTASGAGALQNTTAGFNTAGGADALKLNTTGFLNDATGYASLYSNTTGYQNTAHGTHALYANTTGINNTASGKSALYNNIDGDYNAAVGGWALNLNPSGNYNSALGYSSGTGGGSWNNTISIGNNGYLNGYHDQAFIGNLSTAWIGGNVAWSTYSDARVKTNVTEDVKGLDFITRLRPVTYHRDIRTQTALTGNTETEDFEGKYDIEQIKFSGFLAQEVEQAAIASGYDFSGITTPRHEQELYTLSYEAFVVPLVKAMQEQQEIIADQNQRIAVLLDSVFELEKWKDEQPKHK